MQYNNKDYKPKLHDRWRALTVKNPYATQLVTAAYEDNGIVYGEKCIEVRSKNTPYRGDLMVCSSANPVIAGYENGVTLGLVELYDDKPVAEIRDIVKQWGFRWAPSQGAWQRQNTANGRYAAKQAIKAIEEVAQ